MRQSRQACLGLETTAWWPLQSPSDLAPQPPLQTGNPVKSSKPPMAGIFLHAWEFSTALLRFQETEFVGQRQAAQETRLCQFGSNLPNSPIFLILSRKVNLSIYLKTR